MMTFGGTVIIMVLCINSAFCVRNNDEYSVGTSLNKYLWSQNGEDDLTKREGGEKRTTALWFGPRLGKRSMSNDNLPAEIIEILQRVQKSPELQSILAEKLQVESPLPFVIYIPTTKSESSHLFMSPRLVRDSPDSTQNLNSRPYPPRFGRQFGGLPPYLPRLGRSSSDNNE